MKIERSQLLFLGVMVVTIVVLLIVVAKSKGGEGFKEGLAILPSGPRTALAAGVGGPLLPRGWVGGPPNEGSAGFECGRCTNIPAGFDNPLTLGYAKQYSPMGSTVGGASAPPTLLAKQYRSQMAHPIAFPYDKDPTGIARMYDDAAYEKEMAITALSDAVAES